MLSKLKIKHNTIIRHLLNGAFITVLSYLLIFNPTLKNTERSPATFVNQVMEANIGPDSLIQFIRTAEVSVSDIKRLIDRLEADHLMESDKGQAACYALSKQVQHKINDGHRSKTLRNVIDLLAKYDMIVEIPQSDWSKLFTYSRECAFQDLHCDHLFNRVTGHPYFKGVIVLMGLLIAGAVFFLSRRLIERKRINIKVVTE